MDKPMKRRWWRDTTTPSQLFMNPCDAVNGLTPHLVMDWTALLETFFLCVCSRVYGFPLVCESLFLDVKVTTRWHRPHPTPPPPSKLFSPKASKQAKRGNYYLTIYSDWVTMFSCWLHTGCPHADSWRLLTLVPCICLKRAALGT